MPSAPLVWFLIGVVFLFAELAMPGLILIFFCFGSWIAAIALLVADVSVQLQLVIFLVASLVLLFTLRRVFMRTFGGRLKDGADKELSDRAVGRQALVTTAIRPAAPGEIKFRGSFWRAAADVEISEGATVVIEGPGSDDGLTFRVRPL
ncbi:NfeD family protein [Desulfovibrio sulfodismutans]|uniref:NfeD family protein n=1 Tax=Desulfolutivibrio sulfodismutans TaxID=63561 RepID=A0A7K3NLZ5_9BACT|nr:NfeD family protein [Desulfolutivibrio sulfodismutans]NDY57222.1 NfeD family protein [Desulfolutivibrio sulfodismutans]QLA13836.1 NfeD family protein [Desulfolutivibrio sulfodismutans DSM 3696]